MLYYYPKNKQKYSFSPYGAGFAVNIRPGNYPAMIVNGCVHPFF